MGFLFFVITYNANFLDVLAVFFPNKAFLLLYSMYDLISFACIGESPECLQIVLYQIKLFQTKPFLNKAFVSNKACVSNKTCLK